MNIAVFCSGNGSNLQSIINACKNGFLNANIKLVVSNNENCFALTRAKQENIPTYVTYENDNLTSILKKMKIDLVFLAGYLKKIDNSLIENFDIYNIHPSLLPKYGGKGMYGLNVHRAVIAAKEKYTGITIHKVNSEYDKGSIVAQKVIEVYPDDTEYTLAQRVLENENKFIVLTLKHIIEKVNCLDNFC